MPGSTPGTAWLLDPATPLAFGLVLTRVAGWLSFVPLPFLRPGPELARIVMVLSWSIALYPVWPRLSPPFTPGQMAGWVLAEAFLGIGAGLLTSVLAEAFVFGAQLVATQAGYSYATTIDPNSQADSGVLPVFGQLMASLMFFAAGFDGALFQAFAESLRALPPGQAVVAGAAGGSSVIAVTGLLFGSALRLALPVVGLLLLLDLALALVSRLNQQLQLLTVAFPAKMLLTLLLMAMLGPAAVMVNESLGTAVLAGIRRFWGLI